MSATFDDDPDWPSRLAKLELQTERRRRVLALAREMMLAQMANPEIDEFHFGNMVRMAESWIANEDAYELPEDMR